LEQVKIDNKSTLKWSDPQKEIEMQIPDEHGNFP